MKSSMVRRTGRVFELGRERDARSLPPGGGGRPRLSGFRRLAAAVVVASLVTATAPARAGIVEVTQTFGSASSPIGAPALPFNLNFAQFNPNQGPLASVQVQLQITATVSGYVQSQQLQTQAYDQFSAGVVVGLMDASFNQLSTTLAQSQLVDTPTDIGAFATQNYGPASATGTDAETYTSGQELTEFIGTGQISLSVSIGSYASLTQEPFGKQLLFGPGGESVYGTATIIYTTVTPAPEPSGSNLLLSAAGGLLGFCLIRRGRAEAALLQASCGR